MIVSSTSIEGLKYIELRSSKDKRGSFLEAFSKKTWVGALRFDISQVNISTNHKAGTIRGLHWQADPFGQGKIVYAATGRIFDAVVDINRISYSFGKSESFQLVPGMNALFIPKGVAHGYQALADGASLMYLVDKEYSTAHERGLRYDDPQAAIPWPLAPICISDRDLKWPSLKELDHA